MEEEMEIQIMIPGKRSSSNESERAEKTPKKGKGAGASSSSSGRPKCQVDGCSEDLTEAKEYYRRHRVCELHSKSRIVNVLGLPQRFCQQCSRFHVLEEFDEAKRSCRVRLAGHNERRRKTANDAFMISRLNGNWLKQQEETERLSLALHSGTPPKASNRIKNH